ncbi:copper amine oxidase N-terminal domain-containing protein [Brevibacillus sp. TJ4]|uniref:copper amine oxidase N-terminal domain-containing protein n=1 Tax=Brevibacillus sp. TJ4 TaxID=3234853 RepID=UPI003BA36EAB
MRKKLHAGVSLLLATSVFASPLVLFPQATYALSVEDVSADDTDTDEETEYTIEFEIDKALSAGDIITVKFPSGFKVDKNLKPRDVILEDDDGDEYDIYDVSVSGTTIEVEIDEKISKGTLLILTIDGITNPKSKGDYKISVKTSAENSFKTEEITIGGKNSSSKSGSSGKFDVKLGNSNAGQETSISLGRIKLSTKLREGKTITVTFPDRKMLPSSINRNYVEVNGERADRVTISGSTVRIDVPEDADGDSYLEIDFLKSAGIENPSSGKSYVIEVEYDKKTYKSDSFEIKGSSSSGTSSSAFDVSITNSSPGARTSYTLDFNLDERVAYGDRVEIEFPSVEMVPPVISSANVTVNNIAVSGLSVSGNRVSFNIPSGFSSTNKMTVRFAELAYIINPRTPGSYEIVAKVDGKTYRSKKFDITGNTAPAVPVDNSTATLALSRATASTPTGLQVGIKGLGKPLTRGQDFIEVVLPVGFTVPAYVPANTVTVNGVAANYVGVRGQNLVVFPAQDIPANTAVQINFAETAAIVNPATTGMYSISIFSSEEQGVLFARPVNIVALNGVGFKANVASYTKNGATHALATAPIVVNGHTLMPASFYRDGLGMSVTWNNTSARIVSGNTTMQFTVGSKTATVNGQSITLPEAVQLRNNIPVIPLRAVAERTGYQIIYVNGIYTVYR